MGKLRSASGPAKRRRRKTKPPQAPALTMAEALRPRSAEGLARVFSAAGAALDAATIRRHIRDGATSGPKRQVSLAAYAAWLVRCLGGKNP